MQGSKLTSSSSVEKCKLFSWLGLGGEKVEPVIEIISSQINSGEINKVLID